MKKQIILLASILAFSACETSETGDSLEAKRSVLSEKQARLGELKAEIRTLENEIAEMDTTQTEREILVETHTIQPEPFEHFVKLTGTVSSQENILISSEAAGRVRSIPVNEGQKVSSGQALVRIDNETLGNQLSEAKAAYELAEITYQKRKNLWDQKIGSEIEYLKSKSDYEMANSRYAQIRTQYNNTIIKAPIRGTVDEISVKEGEFVAMGAPVARVVDLDKVEIEAELSEEYLPAVRRGDSVKVEIPSLGISRKSPVTFVSQVINPDNRSFKIKINLENKDGLIKPNILANLMIRDYKNTDALVVKSNTINKDLKGDFVYVAAKGEEGYTIARKKYIQRGKSFGALTEVKEGLSAGDRVITAGFNQVSDGERISVN